MSLRELEQAVESLDSTEYEQFCAWLEDRQAERRLRELRAAIEPALDEAARGEFIDGPSATKRILQRLDDRLAVEKGR
jgi:hypothetical protein